MDKETKPRYRIEYICASDAESRYKQDWTCFTRRRFFEKHFMKTRGSGKFQFISKI